MQFCFIMNWHKALPQNPFLHSETKSFALNTNKSLYSSWFQLLSASSGREKKGERFREEKNKTLLFYADSFQRPWGRAGMGSRGQRGGCVGEVFCPAAQSGQGCLEPSRPTASQDSPSPSLLFRLWLKFLKRNSWTGGPTHALLGLAPLVHLLTAFQILMQSPAHLLASLPSFQSP